MLDEQNITEAQRRAIEECEARNKLFDFVTSFLRFMGSGGEKDTCDPIIHLFGFLTLATRHKLDMSSMMTEVFEILREKAAPGHWEATERFTSKHGKRDEVSIAEAGMLRNSILLVAERTTSDGFSRARQSKRHTALRSDMDDLIVELERNTRSFGGSYLRRLAEKAR